MLMTDLLKVDRNEIYRYMGLHGAYPDERLKSITENVICELVAAATPRYCIKDTSVKIDGEWVLFDSFKVYSKSLSKHLANCTSAVLFAATIGADVDRIVSKYSVISPVKAVAAQAAAAAMIEMYADEVCEKIQKEEKTYLVPRFSPGYGDFSLDFQKKLLELLNAQKRIGLCLTNGNLLTPIKSVTAVIGKTNSSDGCVIHKCSGCPNFDCPFRKE